MILPHEIFRSEHSEAPAWVLLHGFLGSQRNLRTLAHLLTSLGPAMTLDLPNHGEAPSLDPCDYPAMAEAVRRTVQHAIGPRPWIAVGHSMGGKLAMYLALHRTPELQGIVVLDIAPVVYHGTEDPIFSALQQLDMAQIDSRAEADRRLSAAIPERAVRLFVLTNLERTPEGSSQRFRWRLPLDILARNRLTLRGWPTTNATADLPALLIWGTASPYLSPATLEQAHHYFPALQTVSIAGADHWLHVSHASEVLDAIRHWVTGYGKIQ